MDNNEQLKKDMEQLGEVTESMVKNMHKMVEKAMKNISPEQAKLFAEQLNNSGMDQKVKDVKKQTEELKKQFNKYAG